MTDKKPAEEPAPHPAKVQAPKSPSSLPRQKNESEAEFRARTLLDHPQHPHESDEQYAVRVAAFKAPAKLPDETDEAYAARVAAYDPLIAPVQQPGETDAQFAARSAAWIIASGPLPDRQGSETDVQFNTRVFPRLATESVDEFNARVHSRHPNETEAQYEARRRGIRRAA